MTPTAPLSVTETSPGHFKLVGSITEHAELSAVRNAAAKEVELHLGGIRHINSYGVRDWVELLSALRAKGVRVVLAAVSPAMARQMNMIPSTSEGARIDSVIAPFVCPSCGAEDEPVIDADSALKETTTSPHPCPKCGAAVEFDDVPELYFRFLRRSPA